MSLSVPSYPLNHIGRWGVKYLLGYRRFGTLSGSVDPHGPTEAKAVQIFPDLGSA